MAAPVSQSLKLCLKDYDAVGFDLDHTLAKYNLVNLLPLCYDCLAKFLVEQKGYGEDLLRPFELDKDFCLKGLIFDMKQGNLLKLDHNGDIIRASHGWKFMSDREIRRVYGQDRHWEHADTLSSTVNSSVLYRIFENFFDIPAVVLISRIVDQLDRKAGGQLEEYNIWYDILDAFHNAYMPENFSEKTGGFFPVLRDNVSKYVQSCATEVKTWLKNLRKEKKIVFLLTSSYVDFASHILRQALGNDWQGFFDISIFYARKPNFFIDNNPFLEIANGCREGGPVNSLERGKSYSQGNIGMLKSFLRQLSRVSNPKVVYFGDSLRSDIFPSKVYAGWETVLILEEMEAEGLDGFDPKTYGSDDQLNAKKSKGTIVHETPQLEKEFLVSKLWGSFFYDNSLGKAEDHMNTFWGLVIRQYCDICVPQMEYIVEFPLDHKFDVFDHENHQSSGFYPTKPLVLHKIQGT